MADPIIWLHEDALRHTHPVFARAPSNARCLHIWDDTYLKNAGYSFKRLVFLYETLGELPVEIIHGGTIEILRTMAATELYVPASLNPWVHTVISALSAEKKIVMVADEPFVTIQKPKDAKRFFQYWGQAEKTAFLPNGGTDAA